MLLFLCLLFAKIDPKIAKAPKKPPPKDLKASNYWRPDSAQLAVFAAGSKSLKIVDMQFQFQLEPGNYVAIGYGGNKMENSDMIVFTRPLKKKGKDDIVVQRYYSTGYNQPKLMKDKVDVLVQGKKDNDYFVIIRKPVTSKNTKGASPSNAFQVDKPFEMIWARGPMEKNGKIIKHTQAGAKLFEMKKFSPKQAAVPGSNEQQHDTVKKDEKKGNLASTVLPSQLFAFLMMVVIQ